MEQYIKLSPEKVKAIRWLLKAVSRDEDRLALQNVLIEGGKAVATNGFSLYQLRFKDSDENEFSFDKLEDGLYKFSLHSDILEFERTDKEDGLPFPNYKSLLDNGIELEPIAQCHSLGHRGKIKIGVNPKLLQDALSLYGGNQNYLRAVLTMGNLLTVVYDNDYVHAEALIMPMIVECEDNDERITASIALEWIRC